MSNRFAMRRPSYALLLTLAAMGMLGSASLLISLHAAAISQVRAIALPAAAAIPPLKKRAATLREQLEITELQQELSQGPGDEQLLTFVLPGEPDRDRIVELFGLVTDEFGAARWMRKISPIRIAAAEPSQEDIATQNITFDAEMTDEGLRQLQILIRLSGLTTVGDALTDLERSVLLRLTEEQNPAALSVLERFLATPLLQYAREPRPFEDQVLRSFAGEGFGRSFSGILEASLLREAKALFGGALGRSIVGHRLWPLRFLTLDLLSIGEGLDGWHPVNVRIGAYQRRSS